jgi:hypothetical protein
MYAHTGCDVVQRKNESPDVRQRIDQNRLDLVYFMKKCLLPCYTGNIENGWAWYTGI